MAVCVFEAVRRRTVLFVQRNEPRMVERNCKTLFALYFLAFRLLGGWGGMGGGSQAHLNMQDIVEVSRVGSK